MHYKTILLVFGWLFSSQAYSEVELNPPSLPTNRAELEHFLNTLRGETVPYIERILSCASSTEVIANEYKSLVDVLQKKDQEGPLVIDRNPEVQREHYNTNVLDNFVALTSTQSEMFSKLQQSATPAELVYSNRP